MKNPLYPLKLKPFLRDYIWGGTKLKSDWNKVSHLERIAESWEFSTFSKMESRVASGRYAGKTVHEMKEIFPDILGDRVEHYPIFPFLIKLIDASKDLSIQVHPNDEFALLNEMELGKTEIWYIADTEENGAIYYGFNKKVTDAELQDAIATDTLCQLLNHVPVKKGDFFFVPAGTVHAILSGVTVIEIQQNSNITYRLYDYGRVDTNGKTRELHIDKALQVISKDRQDIPDQQAVYEQFLGYKTRHLADTEYFKSREVVINKDYTIENPHSFVTFTVADGEGVFDNGYSIIKGDTFLIPCALQATISSKNLVIIETTL